MRYSVEKPGTPAELVHYGVKGMHWGVRKERETSDRPSAAKESQKSADHNFSTKEYMKALPNVKGPKTAKEAKAIFADNQQKFANKFASSGAPGGDHKLTKQQKEALIWTGAAAAGIGGLLIYEKYFNDSGKVVPSSLSLFGDGESSGGVFGQMFKNAQELHGKHAGGPISKSDFNELVGVSQTKTWYGHGDMGYLQPSAWAREEFELPVGHIFHRISTTAETEFKGPTYSLHNIDDFNRYMIGFTGEKGFGATFNHITWTAKAPIKVPNLTTVMDTMHETMIDHFKGLGLDPPTPEEVMGQYEKFSGGGWSDPTAKKFLAKLADKGYSAIVDEMDAGVIGETPLVFFGDKLASAKRSVPITKADFKASEKNLTELTNRKL